jgi:hypothetical protein
MTITIRTVFTSGRGIRVGSVDWESRRQYTSARTVMSVRVAVIPFRPRLLRMVSSAVLVCGVVWLMGWMHHIVAHHNWRVTISIICGIIIMAHRATRSWWEVQIVTINMLIIHTKNTIHVLIPPTPVLPLLPRKGFFFPSLLPPSAPLPPPPATATVT